MPETAIWAKVGETSEVLSVEKKTEARAGRLGLSGYVKVIPDTYRHLEIRKPSTKSKGQVDVRRSTKVEPSKALA